jgi:hemerythrin-like metal-binding protein
MPFLNWSDRLVVDHPQMDRDHQKLAELLNAVVETLAGGCDLESFDERMDALVKHTLSHFEHEQRLMQASDYPDEQKHLLDHRGLITQVRVFRTAIAEGLMAPGPETLFFLHDWLLAHIGSADRPLADFLRGCGSHVIAARYPAQA